MDSYSLTVPQIEAELDQLWPLWDALIDRSNGVRTKGEPFNALDYPALARTKWLLKRRLLLLRGMPRHGVLVVQDGRKKHSGKCYAHPVPPCVDGSPARPPAPPALPGAQGVSAPAQAAQTYSTAALAFSLRLPVEVIETAEAVYLSTHPAEPFDEAWITTWRAR